MNRRSRFVLHALLVLLVGLTPACGGSSGGSSGAPPAADVSAPLFHGVQSIATAGGAFVRIDWRAAVDEDGAAPTYRIYAAGTTGAQDFGAPVLTTGAGATSAILGSGTTPLIAVGQPVFLVVRAVDGSGNEDQNQVELGTVPVAPGSVAYVSDAAGGTGTLGDPTDPYPTLQDGVTAVEANGQGVVLVDAASGGSTYTEEVDLLVGVTSIGLYGGFQRFAVLPAGPTGAQILGSRDLTNRPTSIAGDGLQPFSDGDLVRLSNGGAPTFVDGFDLRDGSTRTPLTGTMTFQPGSTIVNGVGTLFSGEVSSGDLIQFDADGIPLLVEDVLNDTQLRLRNAYFGAGGSGAASLVDATPEALFRAVDAVVQFSCCRLFGPGVFDADTTTITVASSVRIVGNEGVGCAEDTFRVGGGLSHFRFQGNRTFLRGAALTHDESASGLMHVPSSGLDVYLTHNQLVNNRDTSDSDNLLDVEFDPSMPGAGGALSILVEHNEIRDHSNSGIVLDGVFDVGAGGSSMVVVRRNLCVGSNSESMRLDGISDDPFAGVDGTVEVYENEFFGNDSGGFRGEVGVSADRLTRVMVRDNVFGGSDGEPVEINDDEGGTADTSDRGAYEITFLRNLNLGGGEDFHVDMGAPYGGTVDFTATENTILVSGDPCLDIEVREPIGSTTSIWTYPVNFVCVNVFNNDLHGSDDECIEFDPSNSESSTDNATAVIGYIGFNLCRNGSDGSDGAISVEYFTDNLGCLIERNLAGIGGQDSSEAGIGLRSDDQSLRNEIHVRNNICLLGSGGGFRWDTSGGCAQFVNNTAAYAGQNNQPGFNSTADFQERGDDQAFVLNCLSAFNGGGDLDRAAGSRAFYTLLRDEPVPLELGNIGGDPFFATDLSDLMDFPQVPADTLSGIFGVQATSATRNAGHPSSRYNDTDGSRNDMGAYGGPGGGGPMGTVPSGTPVPFAFVATSPSVHLYSGALLPDDSGTLQLAFNQPVDASTLAAGISVTNAGVSVPGTLDIVPRTKGLLVRFTPTAALTPGAIDLVQVALSTSLRDTSGQALRHPWSFSFGTRPTAPTAELEPNDDSVAGLLPADLGAAQSTGVGPGGGTFEFAATLASATDVDIYSFQAATGARVMATVLDARIGGGNDGSIRLDLYDANLRRITVGFRNVWNDGTAGNGDTYLDHTFATAGTYYLVVTNPDTTAPPQAYGLMGILD